MQRREQAPAYQLPVPGNFLFSSLTFSIFSSYARVRARVLDNNTGTGVLVLVRSSTRVLVHHGTGIAIHVELARVIRVLHSVPVPHAIWHSHGKNIAYTGNNNKFKSRWCGNASNFPTLDWNDQNFAIGKVKCFKHSIWTCIVVDISLTTILFSARILAFVDDDYLATKQVLLNTRSGTVLWLIYN